MNQTVRQIRPPTIDELSASARYQTAEEMVHSVFGEMQPSNRLTVTEAAKQFTRIGSGGGYSTPWSEEKTPYLTEPQNETTSLDYTGVVFLGPARTGKTVTLFNVISHTVKTDPTDMLLVHMDRENARKWSNGDLSRYLAASTAIRSEQLTARQYDNTFDKTFKSGMRLLITYPTPANLSGITVRIGAAIDYDRCEDDIGGEGNLYDLLSKRTTTYKRFGMTIAESSPNPAKEIQDPRWIAKSPHEAPPIRGIFALYNRGDRRRWQWCCPQCEEWFEPDFKLLNWGDRTDPMEARENTVMVCPHNGCTIEPYQKNELNRNGRWIREGEMIEPGLQGRTVARPGMTVTRSTIASFWLKGPAAGYQDWGDLVANYLNALKELEDTGDDSALRKTVTTDQGTYYIPQSRLSDFAPEDLKAAAEDWGSSEEEPTVPEGVRFLIATADVQKSSFVVQIHGFTETGDMVVIDGFKLRLSNRLNANGERLPIDPPAFGEDWDALVSDVLLKTYPLADGSGRRMKIRAMGCDSGGSEGVTTHAYNLWRRLRKQGDGLHRRFCLVKGEPSKTAPHARTTWPDSKQTGKMAVAKGDVPVVLLNSNLMKDRVSTMMARRVEDEGVGGASSGMLRYPDWMPAWFYMQMTTEVRTEKGWQNPRKRRNESFDLAYYALGLAIRPPEQSVPLVTFNLDRLNFEDGPTWAADWDDNEFVFGGKVEEEKKASGKRSSFADLGKKLA